MRQADAVEGFEGETAQKLAERERPESMNKDQFLDAAKLNGWSHIWIYADVLDQQPEGDTNNLLREITRWLDDQSPAQTWAQLYDLCRQAVQ